MKKWALLLALVLGLLTGFSAVSSPRAKSESSAPATFVLPSSLVSIDEEAFAGTAAESVELPDSLTTVGERAFADMPRLRTMSVPASVTFIGEQAFAGVTGLTILAPEGSYAERWAEAHSIACTQCETAVSRLQQLGKLLQTDFFLLLSFHCVCPGLSLARRRKLAEAWKSLRPQDRPELNPIDYRFP